MMQGQVTQMLPTTGAERRTQDRVDIELEISVNSESNFFNGFSENISEGGLFVATYNYKEQGDTMEIEFSLPDGGDPIQIKCYCYSRPTQPGHSNIRHEQCPIR